jgi:hypothetical protein
MSRGKGKKRKGTKVIRKSLNPYKKNLKDAMNPLSGASIPANLRPVIEDMKQGFERRVRFAELKMIHQQHKISKLINDIKANQIVLQTILMEQKVITEQNFADEYRRYFSEVVGIVDDSGKMNGSVYVDTFNIGVPGKPNSLSELREQTKNPVIIK